MKYDEFIKILKEEENLNIIGPLNFESEIDNLATIFVDGGLRHKKSISSLSATISIGDGDSVTNPEDIDIKLDKEKDFNDFSSALTMVPASIKHINLYGLIGERLDHQLTTFGELHYYLKGCKNQVTCNFDDKVLVFSQGQFCFTYHSNFTVIAFEEVEITIKGECKYPIDKATKIKPLSSYTLSNEATGKVSITSNAPTFIFLN